MTLKIDPSATPYKDEYYNQDLSNPFVEQPTTPKKVAKNNPVVCSNETCDFVVERDGLCKNHYLEKLSSNVVYKPIDRVTQVTEYLRWLERTRNQSVPMYIEAIDRIYAPLRPGEVAVFTAVTHNGKSMLVDYVTRSHERNIIENERDGWIIHIDNENMMEMGGLRDLTRSLRSDVFDEGLVVRGEQDINWDELAPEILKMVDGRIIRISASFFNAGWLMEMTVTNLTDLILWIVDGGLTGKRLNVELLVVDYLQAIPADDRDGKGRTDKLTAQIAANFERLFVLAGMLQAPTIVAAQGRHALKAPDTLALPNIAEVAHCSAVGERAAKVVTVTMPKNLFTVGTVVTHKTSATTEIRYPVKDSTMIIGVKKQRGINAPSNKVFIAEWNYEDYSVTARDLMAQQSPEASNVNGFQQSMGNIDF